MKFIAILCVISMCIPKVLSSPLPQQKSDTASSAQAVLTNDQIIEMVKAGLSQSLILSLHR